MYENFKFYAVIDGSFYLVRTIQIDKPNNRARITVEDFQPFTRRTNGGPADTNNGFVPLDNLRLFNPNTMEITTIRNGVDIEQMRMFHYATLIKDFHNSSVAQQAGL